MRKNFFMALVAVMLMSQFAHARLFDRLRARRAGMTNPTAAATANGAGKATTAPMYSSPAAAPAPAPAPPAAPAPQATTTYYRGPGAPAAAPASPAAAAAAATPAQTPPATK